MGVRIHRIERSELLDLLKSALIGDECRYFASVNANAMNIAWEQADFRSALNQADLTFVDGAGVVLAAKLTGIQTGERLTFANWMPDFLNHCSQTQASVFWLGDTDEVGAAFGEWLRQLGVTFAGSHHGFFDRDSTENEEVIRTINNSGAQVLLVGMSMPIQERWILANLEKLQHSRIVIPSGGYARIATGLIPRGPDWMTNNGLEWFYRFLQQPRYTWKRYWLGNPLFILRALACHYLNIVPR